ncbi:MAG TPA: carbamate kinase, partial [Longimicrobiales bacterium]|nr:carbamate kinase [Longimicrobiales bacterium]
LMIPHSETAERQARTIVIAVGGNALQPQGGQGDIAEQFEHTRESLGAVVDLAAKGWRIAVVHGNGPQIGDELLRNEMARQEVPPLPLGVLVASTAGWIGYMIQQSLQNALEQAGVQRSVATLITQVVVDPAEANGRPVKPIGRFMTEAQAQAVARETGWTVGPSGNGWRRLVSSPVPTGTVEGRQIRQLVEAGTIVIAAGGGGTPVYRDPVLSLEGVDAVVDKDRAAEVLAREIGAGTLLILTNVEGAYRAFGTPRQELLRKLGADEADALLAAGEFGEGSMGPKVEAAVAFVRGGGRRAILGRLDQGLQAVQGEAGTTIVP